MHMHIFSTLKGTSTSRNARHIWIDYACNQKKTKKIANPIADIGHMKIHNWMFLMRTAYTYHTKLRASPSIIIFRIFAFHFDAAKIFFFSCLVCMGVCVFVWLCMCNVQTLICPFPYHSRSFKPIKKSTAWFWIWSSRTRVRWNIWEIKIKRTIWFSTEISITHTHTHTIDLSLSFAILLTGNEIFFSFYQHYDIFAFGFDLCSFFFLLQCGGIVRIDKELRDRRDDWIHHFQFQYKNSRFGGLETEIEIVIHLLDCLRFSTFDMSIDPWNWNWLHFSKDFAL